MLAIPALIALVYFFISLTIQLDAGHPLLSPGLLTFLVMLTSAFLVQNEISRERAVYRREQRISSMLFPYVLSKVWLAGTWAIYQGVVWTIISSFGELGAVGIAQAGAMQALLPTTITSALTAFIGGIVGLIVSASTSTTMTTGWVFLLAVPLLLFLFDPLSHWSKLVIISLLLIVLLMAVQQRATNVRT
jgi:hypothetical protein